MAKDKLVEVFSLQKSFADGDRRREVLKNIHFGIERGENVAIVGESGSGKSTILNLVGLILRPDSGQILFRGEESANWKSAKRAAFRNAFLGYIFQDFLLIENESVWENVNVPLLYRKPRKSAEALTGNIQKYAERLGIEHLLKKKAYQLSGGEKQRVAILRAIIGEPELLLADEPTGNLDKETGEKIISLLFSQKEAGRGLLLVTHNEEYSRRCDRRYRLINGVLHSEDN